MYSFEGDFRRKPVQSLRGASKKEETLSLLKRAQNERQKREDVRQRNESAITIQSYYRGHKVRQRQIERLRKEFDHMMEANKTPSVIILPELIQKLFYFYSYKADGQRLIWICQNVIRLKDSFVQHILRQQSGIILIKHLLHICMRHLDSIAATQSPVAIPLRILEVFTAPDIYRSQIDTVKMIWKFLIEKGFFRSMRTLLEAKVPSRLERSHTPPTPQAESIFELIMKPISFAVNTTDKQFSYTILQNLVQSLLCPAFSEQIEQFLLPAMIYGKYPFPFVDLVLTLLQKTSSTLQQNKHDDKVFIQSSSGITPTPWLLGALLSFADKFIEDLSLDDSVKFLLLLHSLIPQLPSRECSSSDSDSDEEEPMDTDSVDGVSPELHKLRGQCVEFLNSQKFVRCVVRGLNYKMDVQLVSSVCMICHSLMSHQHLSIHKLRLLYSLAFNKRFMKSLWYTCVSVSNQTITGSQITLLQTLSRGLPMSDEDINRIVPMLSVFCTMFSHSLYTLHDADFNGETEGKVSSMPFSLKELSPMVLLLRDTCLGIIELAHPDAKLSVTDDYREALRRTAMKDKFYNRKEETHKHTEKWSYLFKVIANVVRQLYTRDARKAFCPENSWLSDRVHIQADKPSQIYRAEGSVFVRRPFGTMRSLTKAQLDDDGPPLSNTDVKNLVILTELPFVVSFEERVKILRKLIQTDVEKNQGDSHLFLSGPSISVMIRRNYIYEDAFDKLSPENEPNLKLKMRVQLINAAGLDEAGIDGGGIFREFLTELLKTGFDPNRGLFLMTTDRLLYPNPQSVKLMENYTNHYYFLGRMLGKAIYENMLVELPFASFFLSKILSRHGGNLDIHHLASLDPEMYRNLLFLKTYDGDVADLGLDFTAVNNSFGETRVEELKPGGRNIAVTNANKIEYIHLMSDYKINKQIRSHCMAFRQGMADLINLEWLRMFDHHELHTLISGSLQPVNIEDLKQHTNYSGGYTADHPVITLFWKVVESFKDSQKRQLLKFVTSCSRPPLLGFKDLYPAFCVHFGGSESDRLPTASTCMNLLKLPEFTTEQTMKCKLLYAIESGSGFELS